MPPRGNQPQERVCAANWRRSLCAAKRDPRLGGYTSPRPPKRKSEGAGAKRKQYYFSFLTPPPLPPLLSRVFPRTPAGGRWRPPCQRGLAALADWGIPTGLAWPPVTPADGQESLRLACARHLPLTREAILAGAARKKAPLTGELAEPARPEGLCLAFRRRPVTPLPPNPLITPNSTPSLSQNFTNFTRSTQNLPTLCKTFTAIVPYYGRNRRKTAVQLACFR